VEEELTLVNQQYILGIPRHGRFDRVVRLEAVTAADFHATHKGGTPALLLQLQQPIDFRVRGGLDWR
jgi:hypothetical protein